MEWPCLRRWIESISPHCFRSWRSCQRQSAGVMVVLRGLLLIWCCKQLKLCSFQFFTSQKGGEVGGEVTHSGSRAYRTSWCQSPLGSPLLLGKLAPAQSLALHHSHVPSRAKGGMGASPFVSSPQPRHQLTRWLSPLCLLTLTR